MNNKNKLELSSMTETETEQVAIFEKLGKIEKLTAYKRKPGREGLDYGEREMGEARL